MRRCRTLPGPGLLLVLAVLAVGCGSGGSTSEIGKGKDPFAGYPKGPTRQFILPGSDNVVQEFGREATAAERQQASVVVGAWLRARARGEWMNACSHMHKGTISSALGAAARYGDDLTTCPRALALLTRQAEPPRDNIKGGVASLRIESGQGFAQYHGKDGRDWILSVRREDGSWRVADLAPIERLK